jgi:hypothetical protein
MTPDLQSSRLVFAAILALAITFGVTYAIASGKPNEPEPVECYRVRQAIILAEGWDGCSRGHHGERGPMQIKASTWYQFSHAPHSWADACDLNKRAEAERVEVQYTYWLIHACVRLDKPVTPYMVGLIHNAGYGTVRDGTTEPQQVDFAMRVSNLYYAK